MPTTELGCDINNIQLIQTGNRRALREREIQGPLYLAAQLACFMFTQGKRLRCTAVDGAKQMDANGSQPGRPGSES